MTKAKTNKKNTNHITEMVFILDRSGSMSGLESDTIGGFNSLIEKQKKADGTCFVSTVLFSDKMQTVHDRVALKEIEKMTDKDYIPMGCTALYDAIGNTVAHITNIHRYIREEDVPANTVFVIITDGYENASREYTHEKVKALVESKKEKDGWEFMFIGANIDAVETAAHIGISGDRAVNYHADERGTGVVYDVVADACCTMRSCAPLEASWSDEINEDFKNR